MARNKLIQIRRDTAANWASVNPVLASGEAGFETDTKKIKYGNGVLAWNALPYPFISEGELVVNVKNYGVVGDGITDDAAAIQSAIATAVSLKRKLFFPGGTYKINSGIVIDDRVHMVGSLGDTVLDFSSMSSGICITIGNINAITGFTMQGFTLNGNSSITGIKLNATNNVLLPVADSRFTDLRIQNFGTGIRTAFSWDDFFENIRFQSCVNPAAFDSQSNNMQFNRVSFVTFTGTVSFINCEGLQFDSCEFANSGSANALSLFQSNIEIINPYIENVVKLCSLGALTETFPSVLRITGGLVTGSITLGRNDCALDIIRPRITIGLSILNDPSSPKYYMRNVRVEYGNGSSAQPVKDVITQYNGSDDFPYSPAFGGGIISHTQDSSGYAVVTASQGCLLTTSLVSGRQYVFAYRVRTDAALSIRHGINQSISSQAISAPEFETRYIPFIANSTDFRLEWDGVSQIEHLSITEQLYFVNSGFNTTVIDATTTAKGKVMLTGDLGGTAASPTVPGLTTKAPIASPTFTGVITAPTVTLTSPTINIQGADTASVIRMYGGLGVNGAGVIVGGSTASGLSSVGALRVGTTSIGLWDSGGFYPGTTLTRSLGIASFYWSNVYAQRHTFNSTAYLDGSVAGTISLNGTLTANATSIITDTTTGLKIGIATNQKLGFYNSTPVIQPTGSVITALGNLGLVFSPTIAESDVTNLVSDLAAKAPLASPALTGSPTAPTQSIGDNSTKLATTAYVDSSITSKQDTSEKNQVNGYAGLDSNGKVVSSLLPSLAITETFVVASQVAMLAVSAQQGDVAVRTDINKSYILTTNDPTVLANWQELLTPTDAVLSFNSRTGAIVPVSGDYTSTMVTNTPSGNIAATTAQAAINELDTEKVSKAGDTMTGALTVPSVILTSGNFNSSSTAGLLRMSSGTIDNGGVIVMGGSTNGSIPNLGILRVGTTNIMTWSSNGVIIHDAKNIFLDTTTGTKIGTATNQKLAFFNSTPIVQPSGSISTALSNLGLVASPTIAQSDVTNLVSDLAKSSRQLFSYIADSGNTTTAETDLYSDSIVASTLSANKDKLIARYSGEMVNSATATRQLKVYFGGTLIFDTGALSLSASSDWDLDIMIIRVSSSVVRYSVKLNLTGASLSAYANVGELTGLTLSNSNILKITGQAAGVGAATNDIVAKLGNIEWKPAP